MILPVLYVSDVDTSCQYYTDKLGAIPGTRIIGANGRTVFAEMCLLGVRIHLMPVPMADKCFAPMQFRIEVGADINMNSLYTFLRANGVMMYQHLEERTHGVSFGVKDPDGFCWRFERTAYAMCFGTPAARPAQCGVA